MPYPTPGAYQEAVQFPETAFTDPVLQRAEPEVSALGLPKVITGAFAAVFPVQTRTARWAAKCFLTDVRDQTARYAAISDALLALDLPYTLPFEYQPQGIRVDGEAFPLLKMAWIEGEPLNRFAERHREAPDVLRGLAARWARLLADFEEAGLAHGDLQHGNVLIDSSGALRLVDYDTMYVPALKGRRSPEVGHRNYQHPDRSERDFGPHLDRFSSLAIYVALRALIARPELWARYDTGENLLFRAADFYDPAHSPLFDELLEIADIRPLAEALYRSCYAEPAATPPLADVLALLTPEAGRPASKFREAPLPIGRQQRRDASRRPSRPRSLLERLFAPLLLACLLFAVLLAVFGGSVPAFALGTSGILAASWAAWVGYRRLPDVRRRHHLRREEAYFNRLLGGLESQVRVLREERTRFADQLGTMREERLREVQQEALRDRLKYHFVGEAASFEGVRHRVVVRLKAAGIRNAFQATPDRLADVREIGDESRARVALWRAGLAARYQADVPDVLSPAELRRLERRFRHRMDALDGEAERLEGKIQVQRQEQADVQARTKRLPPFHFRRYLRYLLYLGTLPAHPAPSPPSLPQKNTPAIAVSSDSPSL